MTKYIFVTGGVVSSLGKGITAASVGCLLKRCGLRVNILKFDPYLNVDPGTMSPFQHGEVFVTEDGTETDLDLGHYERFLDIDTKQENNATSGVIYDNIILKERRGDFLGGTVQVVPHVTNEIKSFIKALARNKDVVIIEIGGTVGDIESLPFLEAIRQFRQDVGRENVCYIHVTLIPFIQAASEMKTKPTQQSVAKLREIGIEPQIIICRTEKRLTHEIKAKISLFCNVKQEAVIEEKDVAVSVYEVPLMLRREGLDRLILRFLHLPLRRAKLKEWEGLVERLTNPKGKVTVGVAGKYTELKDAYKSIWEALVHAGAYHNVSVDIRYIDVERENLDSMLGEVDSILIPGGFGERGIEGKIKAANFARIKNVPYLGICLGMQCAVIEFIRNVCGFKGANSTEFDPETIYPVIDLMSDQKEKIAQKGGTMRLGSYPCNIKRGTLTFKAYNKAIVRERHRHRYELNNRFRKAMEKNGMLVSGVYKDKQLVEIIEIKGHPWFVGVQFHPEFKSRPLRPHPLFCDFIAAGIRRSSE